MPVSEARGLPLADSESKSQSSEVELAPAAWRPPGIPKFMDCCDEREWPPNPPAIIDPAFDDIRPSPAPEQPNHILHSPVEAVQSQQQQTIRAETRRLRTRLGYWQGLC